MAQVQITGATAEGDRVTVAGTVDGKEVIIQCWKSHLDSLANKAAKVAYVAGLLKDRAQPAAPAAIDLAATVTV
jgi:hypothetical protein